MSIFCQPEWGDTQVYVGFDAVVTDSAQVGFNTVGADFIFLLNRFKKRHLWFWLLVSLPSLPDLPFLCLTCFLKLLVEFSVLSPIFSLLRLSYLCIVSVKGFSLWHGGRIGKMQSEDGYLHRYCL